MCYYITIATADPILRREVPRNLHLSDHTGDLGGHEYPKLRNVYGVTWGPCSCDLLNSTNSQTDVARQLESRKASYEKKGWSNAKISRALGDSRKTDLKAPALNQKLGSFLDTLLIERGQLEAIVHFHNGPFYGEKFTLAAKALEIPVLPSELDSLFEDTRLIWAN